MHQTWRWAFPVILLLATTLAAAGGYLWPTRGIAVELTSVMCDKRNDHPHAGIDLSLHGRVGTVPIVAVGDGVLMRIRDNRHGYGKALYVRMPDKRVAVYAHLDRFSPRLQQIGEDLRRRQGLRRLDYYFEEWELTIPIARGEVIAYGGNTGTSTAHLHFELRDDDIVNLNPLTNGFPVEDHLAPTIRAALVVPVSPDARVAGAARSRVVPIPAGNAVANPIRVKGRVGLAVDAFDRTRSKGRRFAPYRIGVVVDGEPFFETRYEQWSWFEKSLIWAQYDVGAKQRLFHRAYNPYPVDIPFFSAAAAGTFDRLPPGPHKVEVAVADAAGNSSSFTLAIEVEAGDVTKTAARGEGSHGLFNNRRVAVDDGAFYIAGEEFSFYEPVRINVVRRESPLVGSTCYTVSDPGTVMRRDHLVGFRLPETEAVGPRPGIVHWKRDKAEWLEPIDDGPRGYVAARTSEFGIFCLAGDGNVPAISNVRRGRGRAVVTFSASDDLSGLTWQAAQVLIDGKSALAYYEPGRGVGGAEIYWALKTGAHKAEITLTDRAGNQARRSFGFNTR
ncbi:MAG: M23 family metallopeptidase [Candidatus Lernaella stagnicola]|nr:M23 family metallopeptidase [Candidatus Lernaella stagnicola]